VPASASDARGAEGNLRTHEPSRAGGRGCRDGRPYPGHRILLRKCGCVRRGGGSLAWTVVAVLCACAPSPRAVAGPVRLLVGHDLLLPQSPLSVLGLSLLTAVRFNRTWNWMDPSVSAAVLGCWWRCDTAEHGRDLLSQPPCFTRFASTGTGWHATSTPGGCPSLTAPRRVDLTDVLSARNGVGGKPCPITETQRKDNVPPACCPQPSFRPRVRLPSQASHSPVSTTAAGSEMREIFGKVAATA
jgi:hypothetical protein